MEGLIGLTKSINDRDSAIRDLSVLERMDNRIQQDKQAEVMAQQQEQAFYEKMYQAADGMLEKDRIKINKKVLMSQKQLREHLDRNGGSRKTFMENGGLSALNQISNDIIHSDEAVRFGENKKNLAKILEAQEKGFGHRIAPNDLKSLEDYENNEDGSKITYSGLLNEIEIPPSALFDYGTEIPIENIMSFGSNAIKLRQNYAIAYPDKPQPPTWKELMAFSREMGYGGMGSNTEAMRIKLEQQRIRAKYEQENSTNKDKSKIGLVNELNHVFQNVPSNLTVSAINTPKEEGGFGGSVLEYMKQQNPGLTKIIGEKSVVKSQKRTLEKDGVDFKDVGNTLAGPLNWLVKGITGKGAGDLMDAYEYVFNSNVGLKESYSIAQGNEGRIAKRILGDGEGGLGYKIEGGQILDFEPTEDMYRMDGVKLTGNNKLEKDKYKGAYKVKGFVTALKSIDSTDESEMLLIDIYKGNGKKDDEATKTVDAGYTQNAQMTTVLALEDEKGNIFYKEVNIRDTDLGTVVSNALGSDNDLTETVNQQNQSLKDIEAISKNTTEEQIQFQGAINTMDNEVFNDPMFRTEGEKYFGPQSAGQQNRYDMMKSFYMAFDYINNSYKRDQQNPNGDPNVYSSTTQKAVDNNIFTTIAKVGQIEDKLSDYSQGNSAESIIVEWLENINEDLEPGSLPYKQNQELASKWIQLNKML